MYVAYIVEYNKWYRILSWGNSEDCL